MEARKLKVEVEVDSNQAIKLRVKSKIRVAD